MRFCRLEISREAYANDDVRDIEILRKNKVIRLREIINSLVILTGKHRINEYNIEITNESIIIKAGG